MEYLHYLKRIYTVRKQTPEPDISFMTCTMMMSPLKLLNFHLLSQKEERCHNEGDHYPGNRAVSVREMEDVPQLSKSEKVTDIVQAGMSDEGIKPVIQLPGQEKYLRIKGIDSNKSMLFKEHMRTQKKHQESSVYESATEPPVTQQKKRERRGRKGRRRWRLVRGNSRYNRNKESDEASQPSMENREKQMKRPILKLKRRIPGNEAESVEEETITDDLP